jgi:mycobactin peptide synthetase MbtE
MSVYQYGDRVDRVVEQFASRLPQQVAVCQDDARLTYAELWAHVSTVAVRLTRAGVGPGDVVPVLLDRSLALVAILLGIHRAGAAYACLDPAWPQGRIADALDRIDGRLLIDDADAWLAPVTGVPPQRGAGTDPACVFFTSGSSGRPKGVVAPHRGLVRATRGIPKISVGPKTVFLAASPLPWDGFAFDLFLPLLNGGTCVLDQPGSEPLDAERLAAHLAHGVNSLFLTSPLFTILAEEAPDLLAPVELLFVGGDRMNTAAAAGVLSRFPQLRLVNGYGPAENSIIVTSRVVEPGDVAETTTDVPIGVPISHTEVVLLGPDGSPVPDGALGEIVAGGDGVALGYLGDPEETARRFFTVTDGSLPPGRYYRTGDLAVRDTAGQLRYRGRVDRQIKLNGIRIEPGEIEAVLESCPGVTGCVVTLLPGPHRPALAAAYTTVDGQPLDPATLRTAALAHLLPTMVPAVLRHLDRFPLNSGGKVDVAAIQALLAHNRAAQARSDDTLLAGIADMIGHPDLRADDDLLAAGLTSLDAVRIAARCTTHLGVSVTLADIYRARSVAALRRRAAGRPGRIAVAPPGDDTDLPLTHAQRRFVIAEWLNPRAADNQVVEVFRIDGPLDEEALATALRRVVERHVALRTVLPLHNGQPTQRLLACDEIGELLEVLPAGPDPQEFADACRRYDGFALDRQLPVRFVLGRVGAGCHLLALHMHHVAIDGRSEQVLIGDLLDAYADVRAGRAPRPMPEPSYRMYAAWERSELPQRRAADLDYWRSVVDGLPAPLFSTRSGETANRWSVRTIDADTVGRLTALAIRHGGPPVTGLAAAIGQALRRTFAASAVTLGMITDGRADPAFADVVGCFVNTVLLSLDSAPDPVAAAAAAVVGGLDHGATPYDEVLRELRRAGDPRPWFQTMFVLQNARPGGDLAPGLTLTAVRTMPERNGRDCTVQAFPRPDGGWDLVMEVRADAVDDATAARLGDELDASIRELAKETGS